MKNLHELNTEAELREAIRESLAESKAQYAPPTGSWEHWPAGWMARHNYNAGEGRRRSQRRAARRKLRLLKAQGSAQRRHAGRWHSYHGRPSNVISQGGMPSDRRCPSPLAQERRFGRGRHSFKDVGSKPGTPGTGERLVTSQCIYCKGLVLDCPTISIAI